MDLRMPNKSGYETLNDIRMIEGGEKIPVIAHTASAMKKDREKIQAAGFDGFLEKPVSKSKLMEELIKHLTYYNASKVASVNVPSETNEFVLSEIAKENINEIYGSLSGYFSEKIEEAKKHIRIKQIQELAIELVEYGNKFDLQILMDYGNKLDNLSKSFNRKKLFNVLEEYESLVNYFKNWV